MARKKKKTSKKGSGRKKRFVISRKSFLISIIVLLIVASAIIILANLGYEKEVQDDLNERGIEDFDEYYAGLIADCEGMPSTQKGCCIESANLMMKWRYLEPIEGVCPKGKKLDTLKYCEGSYEWCE